MTLPKREQAPPTVSSDAVAQDQIRAFVERIIRMREEAKAINGDIREIYAEAKGNGFDKTILGRVVLYVEKRATKAAEMLEAEALFDLYLEAFDGGTGTRIARAHTHEAEPVQVADQSTAARKDVPEVTRSGKLGTVISEDSALAAPELTDERMPGSQDPKPESGNQAPPVDTTSNITTFTPKPFRPYCLSPGNSCAGQGRVHCHRCEKAHAAAPGEIPHHGSIGA